MKPGIRGEKEELREALGSAWDLDSGKASKGLFE